MPYGNDLGTRNANAVERSTDVGTTTQKRDREDISSPQDPRKRRSKITTLSDKHDDNDQNDDDDDMRSDEVNELETLIPENLYACSLLETRLRLLTLEPGIFGAVIDGEVEEFSMDHLPAYSALSYVWGREPPIHPIRLNNGHAFIRPNLLHALQRIRSRTEKLRIWVDSLCINQDDAEERNAQVRMMSSIYQNADAVLIWLGEEDSTSKLVFEFVTLVIDRLFQWDDLWWQRYNSRAFAEILDRAGLLVAGFSKKLHSQRKQ
ncbi:hypothetical protein ACN47E_009015 [Coniothyrium glycines]